MKFCQLCGRPLNDGEVCNCQAQQAAPQQPQYQPPQPQPQPQYQQPQPQYQQPQQYAQYPQQQYAQPAPQRPAGSGKFAKALKNMPVAFKSYFKNTDKVIGTAKAKKDILLPLLYVAVFFLVNLILGICFFARATSYTYWEGLGVLQGCFGGINRFNFGLVLLAALIMTVVVCVLYVGVRFLSQVIFAKKAPGEAIIDSFIEFGFHLIPVSCLVLLGALLGLATSWLIAPFLGVAASYLVVMYISAALKDAENYQNKLVVTLVMTFCVMLTVAIAFWMLYLMCKMNYSYVPGSSSSSYSDYSDYDYSDLLKYLSY